MTSMDELKKMAETHPVYKRHAEYKQWLNVALIEDPQQRIKKLVELFDARVKQDDVNDYYEHYDAAGYSCDDY